MAIKKKRYFEMVKTDTTLIKKLKKHDKELSFAKERTKKHKLYRDKIKELVEQEPKNQKQEMELITQLTKVEKSRNTYAKQTHFLLFADYIDEMEKVQIFFPAPEKKKKKKGVGDTDEPGAAPAARKKPLKSRGVPPGRGRA